MVDFIGVFNSRLDLRQVQDSLDNDTVFSAMRTRDALPEYAAVIAKKMGGGENKVTTTQLRRFYTYIKSIEMANRDKRPEDTDIIDKYKLSFILPKIAGSGEKQQKSLKGLYDIFYVCLVKRQKIKNIGDLRIFIEFFEAILDFHASLPK
jgi:CRISPR-associated protein Csm2